MSTINMFTPSAKFSIESRSGEMILETIRRENLSIQGFLFLDDQQNPISVSHRPATGETINAVALRNVTPSILNPAYSLIPADNFVTEIFIEDDEFSGRKIVQLTKEDAFDLAYSSFSKVLARFNELAPNRTIQIALSAGGDSRVIAECAAQWQNETKSRFKAVICSLGFEDQDQHIENAVKIAEQYNLEYETYDDASGASLIGLKEDFRSLGEKYQKKYENDDVEVIGTIWLQEIHRKLANDHKRSGIIFGYNQEDVIADHLYNSLLNSPLPPYPIRRDDEIHILAPLCFVPKKVLDAIDLDNSKRNYEQRVISNSYTRSAMYNLAYHIVEKFPLLADAWSGAGLKIENDDPWIPPRTIR